MCFRHGLTDYKLKCIKNHNGAYLGTPGKPQQFKSVMMYLYCIFYIQLTVFYVHQPKASEVQYSESVI